MKRLLLLLVLLGAAGSSQEGRYYDDSDYFIAYKETTAATSEAITIQQPASGARTVHLVIASVYCSVACTATFEIDGAAATTTTLAIAPIVLPRSGSVSIKTTAFSASNVGAGTVLGKTSIGAGVSQPFDLTGIKLQGDGTGKNFTIKISSASGNYVVQIKGREQR